MAKLTEAEKLIPPDIRRYMRGTKAPVPDRRKNPRLPLEKLNEMGEEELQENVKKATEAPDDRPWWVKALDVIDVPRNAIANVIGDIAGVDKTKLRTGTFGAKKVYVSDILDKLGVKNPVAKGILGFAGDVAIDPLLYVSLAARTGMKLGANIPRLLKGGQAQVRTAAGAIARGAAKEIPESVAKAVTFAKVAAKGVQVGPQERLAKVGEYLAKRKMARGMTEQAARKAVEASMMARKEGVLTKRLAKAFTPMGGGPAQKSMLEGAGAFLGKYGETGRTIARAPFMERGLTLPIGKRATAYKGLTDPKIIESILKGGRERLGGVLMPPKAAAMGAAKQFALTPAEIEAAKGMGFRDPAITGNRPEMVRAALETRAAKAAAPGGAPVAPAASAAQAPGAAAQLPEVNRAIAAKATERRLARFLAMTPEEQVAWANATKTTGATPQKARRLWEIEVKSLQSHMAQLGEMPEQMPKLGERRQLKAAMEATVGKGKPAASLTPEERASIDWITTRSEGINKAMRTGEAIRPDEQAIVQSADAALAKLPARPGEHMRMVQLQPAFTGDPNSLTNFLASHKPGATVEYPGYTHAFGTEASHKALVPGGFDVMKPGAAEGFARLHLQGQSGRLVRPFVKKAVLKNEWEIVYPRGTKWVVDRVERGPGGLHEIYMREVTGAAAQAPGAAEVSPEAIAAKMREAVPTHGDLRPQPSPLDKLATAGGLQLSSTRPPESVRLVDGTVMKKFSHGTIRSPDYAPGMEPETYLIQHKESARGSFYTIHVPPGKNYAVMNSLWTYPERTGQGRKLLADAIVEASKDGRSLIVHYPTEPMKGMLAHLAAKGEINLVPRPDLATPDFYRQFSEGLTESYWAQHGFPAPVEVRMAGAVPGAVKGVPELPVPRPAGSVGVAPPVPPPVQPPAAAAAQAPGATLAGPEAIAAKMAAGQSRVDASAAVQSISSVIQPRRRHVYRIVTGREYEDALRSGFLKPGAAADTGGTVNFSKEPIPLYAGSAYRRHGIVVEVPEGKLKGSRVYPGSKDLYLESQNAVPLSDASRVWGIQFTGSGGEPGLHITDLTDIITGSRTHSIPPGLGGQVSPATAIAAKMVAAREARLGARRAAVQSVLPGGEAFNKAMESRAAYLARITNPLEHPLVREPAEALWGSTVPAAAHVPPETPFLTKLKWSLQRGKRSLIGAEPTPLSQMARGKYQQATIGSAVAGGRARDAFLAQTKPLVDQLSAKTGIPAAEIHQRILSVAENVPGVERGAFDRGVMMALQTTGKLGPHKAAAIGADPGIQALVGQIRDTAHRLFAEGKAAGVPGLSQEVPGFIGRFGEKGFEKAARMQSELWPQKYNPMRVALWDVRLPDGTIEPRIVPRTITEFPKEWTEQGLTAAGERPYMPTTREWNALMESGKSPAQPLVGASYKGPQFVENVPEVMGRSVARSSRDIAFTDMGKMLGGTGVKMDAAQAAANPNLRYLVPIEIDKASPLHRLLAPHLEGKVFPQPVADIANNYFRRLGNPGAFRAFLKNYDTVYSHWKALALIHPAYWLRNMVQGIVGTAMAGASVTRMTKNTFDPKLGSLVDAALAGKPIPKVMIPLPGGPVPGEVVVRHAQLYNQINSMATSQMMRQGGPEMLSDLGRRGYGFFFNFANRWESRQRFGLFVSLLQDGMNPQQAAMRVIMAMPDLSDLTVIEKGVFRRIFPWYSWMRRNGALQLHYLLNEPGWLAGSEKLRHAIETVATNNDAVPEELRPGWMGEQQAAQIAGDNQKGYVWLMASWLPFQDIVKLGTGALNINSATKAVWEQMTPAIKVPSEIATGHDIFKGQEVGQIGSPIEGLLNVPMALFGASATPLDNLISVRPFREAKRMAQMPSVGGAASRLALGGAIQPVSKEYGASAKGRELRDLLMKLRVEIARASEAGDEARRKSAVRRYTQAVAQLMRIEQPGGAKSTRAMIQQAVGAAP